ncbi:hypothetical protein AJ78_08734 [Emergomyces pasteurianus Ep9510]|uniref:Tyr recombinase domain-containing protein n=1 Tax=Emergomyces pasteurianus Ep9510 TaxID=1447872 RepID=A0A1J9PQK3_9EURO|nr:hypothetical protein AJ78_08734 [Emergomyces pasteurianus Ep9510]
MSSRIVKLKDMLENLMGAATTSTEPEVFEEEALVEETEHAEEICQTIMERDPEETEIAGLRSNIYEAAEGALAETTLEGYNGQIRLFEKFSSKLPKALQKSRTSPDANTPLLICIWIGFNCEKPEKSDDWILRDREDKTWSHAMKMRAAVFYYYAQRLERGRAPYLEKADGSWGGNPVYSDIVSQYMKSLRRRKTRDGERSESVRLVSLTILQQLFEYNASRVWGGVRQRIMMSLIYAISFLCFLRIEETLRIEYRHIRIHDARSGKMELVLDFRKTHQTGEVPWFDVPSLLVEWLNQSGIRSGYLFRGFDASDQPSLEKNSKLTPGVFLQNFRHNLSDIKENWMLYGGHSFRRGGVQHMIIEKRWSIIKCCSWGGWSTDLNNLTIVRYILGDKDDPIYARQDFLNPEAQVGKHADNFSITSFAETNRRLNRPRNSIEHTAYLSTLRLGALSSTETAPRVYKRHRLTRRRRNIYSFEPDSPSPPPSVNPTNPSPDSRTAEEQVNQQLAEEITRTSLELSAPVLEQFDKNLPSRSLPCTPPPPSRSLPRTPPPPEVCEISESSLTSSRERASQPVGEIERVQNTSGENVNTVTNSYKGTEEFQERWLTGKPRNVDDSFYFSKIKPQG